MNLKRILGYTLLITSIVSYIRVVVCNNPWWVIPLSLIVGAIFLGLVGLIIWLINTGEKTQPLTNEQLIKLGFEPLPHFTVMNSLNFDLGRDRQLCIGCAGTPNEMLFLRQGDGGAKDDLIVLHNFDYDGLLTLDKLEDLLEWFGKELAE